VHPTGGGEDRTAGTRPLKECLSNQRHGTRPASPAAAASEEQKKEDLVIN